MPISVLKIGGANLQQPEFVEQLSAYVVALRREGRRVVVVHGGGPEIGSFHDALGVPFEKSGGLRVTSAEGMEITTMVLCGLVNKRIAARFVSDGVPAVGLSGIDLGLLKAELLDEPRLGRVGNAPSVRRASLEKLLDAGLVPVIAPVSLGPEGDALNVNADTAAHAIATALEADSLDFVSDVPGVRTRAGSPAVARRLRVDEVERLLKTSSVVKGGMLPKLRSAVAAVAGGVGRVRVGDLPGMARGSATEVVA
jgi:acetylglutamate kinase